MKLQVIPGRNGHRAVDYVVGPAHAITKRLPHRRQRFAGLPEMPREALIAAGAAITLAGAAAVGMLVLKRLLGQQNA